MIDVPLASDVVGVYPIVRQMNDRVLISVRPQPGDMLGQGLANRFVVIQNADFLPHPLHDPHAERSRTTCYRSPRGTGCRSTGTCLPWWIPLAPTVEALRGDLTFPADSVPITDASQQRRNRRRDINKPI
jgi:hypothetical protein